MAKERGKSKINIYNILAWVPIFLFVTYYLYVNFAASNTSLLIYILLLITPIIGLVSSVLAIKLRKGSRLFAIMSLIINIVLTLYVIWGLLLLTIPSPSPDVMFDQADLDAVVVE